MTSGKQADLILLDFSKAFDNVNHLKLLYKLQVHGVQGKTLGWTESFLVGRTQCVVLDGEASFFKRHTPGHTTPTFAGKKVLTEILFKYSDLQIQNNQGPKGLALGEP